MGEERALSPPLAICPPLPPPPQQRYRGDPRLQPPIAGGVRGKRDEEGGRVGESERAAWPPHQLVVRKTFRRVDGAIPT